MLELMLEVSVRISFQVRVRVVRVWYLPVL
jgi:hypothetical protein